MTAGATAPLRTGLAARSILRPRRPRDSAPRRLALVPILAALAGCGPEPAASPPPPLPAPPPYATATALHPHFSGEKALAQAARITQFGPRPSGSPALEQLRKFFEAELKSHGWLTDRQSFEDSTPRGRINFVNLRARFPAPDSPWSRALPLLIASHYDTKFYDNSVFVGANDGASGNAVMLELARLLASQPALAQRVEFVFLDGEEASVTYTPTDGLHGSRHYARHIRELPRDRRPSLALVLDMVGDRDLRIGIPTNSSIRLRDLAFNAAEEAGTRRHFRSSPTEVLDDHVPLAMAGLDVTNFIDLEYPPWHTPADTIDKLSAESLAISGKTALLLVEKYLLR